MPKLAETSASKLRELGCSSIRARGWLPVARSAQIHWSGFFESVVVAGALNSMRIAPSSHSLSVRGLLTW